MAISVECKICGGRFKRLSKKKVVRCTFCGNAVLLEEEVIPSLPEVMRENEEKKERISYKCKTCDKRFEFLLFGRKYQSQCPVCDSTDVFKVPGAQVVVKESTTKADVKFIKFVGRQHKLRKDFSSGFDALKIFVDRVGLTPNQVSMFKREIAKLKSRLMDATDSFQERQVKAYRISRDLKEKVKRK